jgi:hypothetical protein
MASTSTSTGASTALPGAIPSPSETTSRTLSCRQVFVIGGSDRVVAPYWVETGKALLSPSLRRLFQKELDSNLADEAVRLFCESMHGTDETMPSAESISEIDWADAFRYGCDGASHVTSTFHETMRQLALRMAQTRPSSFRDEFEALEIGDGEAGRLSSTLFTRQWMGARILFGSPWHLDPDGNQRMQVVLKEGAHQFDAKKEPTECWAEAWNRKARLLSGGQSAFDPARNEKDKKDSERLHTIMHRLYVGPTLENYRDVFQDVLKPEPVCEEAWTYLQVATSLGIRMALTNPRVFKEEFCQNFEGLSTSSLNPTIHTMQWMGAHEAFGCPWRSSESLALKESKGESLPPPDKPKLPTSRDTPQINFVAAEEVHAFLEADHLSVVAHRSPNTTWTFGEQFLSELKRPVDFIRPNIFDVNRAVDLQLAQDMHTVYNEKVKLCSKERGVTVLEWVALFHDIFENSGLIPSKYPNLTCEDLHGMRVLATTMANTPPSHFPLFFTQRSKESDGYLIRTYFTEQWMAATEVFGSPWYESRSSLAVYEGLHWVPVSLTDNTTTKIWQACRELTDCKDLVGFTMHEDLLFDAHNVARKHLSMAVARDGQEEQDDYTIGNWLYVFETAFIRYQSVLLAKGVKILREFACRLALTPPCIFDDYFVPSPTDAERQGFLGYVTHPPVVAWLAARALFGCPWNLINCPGRSLELLGAVAESVLEEGLHNTEADENDTHELDEDHKEVLATINAVTRNDLLVIANTYAPTASDFLKVLVAGVVGAKLVKTDLLDFLMPHTDKQLRDWEAHDKVAYASVNVLENAGKIKEGYLALRELKTTAARNAAEQLGLPAGAVLPGYKIFLTFLRRCRQTFSDMRHMNAHMDKEAVKHLVFAKFKSAKTLGKFDSILDDLKKKYKKARSKRKGEEKRKKARKEEGRKTREEEARQEEDPGKQDDDEGKNSSSATSETTDVSASQLRQTKNEKGQPNPTVNDDYMLSGARPSESSRFARASSRKVPSSLQDSNRTPTRSNLEMSPLRGQHSNKTPTSEPRGRRRKQRASPTEHGQNPDKKTKKM